MSRRPPRSTRTYTLFPYTTLFRSITHFIAFLCYLCQRDSNFTASLAPFAPAYALFSCSGEMPCCSIICCLKRIGPVPSPMTVCRQVSRSEEHTSELQSLMRISYAVFCLTKKNTNKITNTKHKQQ